MYYLLEAITQWSDISYLTIAFKKTEDRINV